MFTKLTDLPAQFPSDHLQNKAILITGATSGIGSALSLACSAHGAEVILLGRNQQKCELLYDEIVKRGYPKPAIVPCDLLQMTPDDALALAKTIEETFGRLDGLVHNAAILERLCPIEHLPPELWQKTLHTNLHAPYLLTSALLPLLKKTENASILFTIDAVGHFPKAYWGAYAVSKAALETFAQILHQEVEVNTSLRVNCLYPGKVQTKLRKKAYPESNPDWLKPTEAILPYLYLLGPTATLRGKLLDGA